MTDETKKRASAIAEAKLEHAVATRDLVAAKADTVVASIQDPEGLATLEDWRAMAEALEKEKVQLTQRIKKLEITNAQLKQIANKYQTTIVVQAIQLAEQA